MRMTTVVRGTVACIALAVVVSGCSSGESEIGAQSALGLTEESDQPPEEDSALWGPPRVDFRIKLIGTCVIGGSRSRVVCPGADMRGENLRGLNLSRANLTGANLTSANLSYVDAYGADLREANLSGATVTRMMLQGADLSGAVWTDGRKCAPGSVGACR